MNADFSLEFSRKYHSVLCREFPSFLEDFLDLKILKRLGGVGLLCGTDYTPLFHNSFFYSRLEHSVGVALIIWNFTKDKKQTVAGLLHDVSTPAFSHVSDFKNGDALKQESTEDLNARMIHEDLDLEKVLKKHSLTSYDVDDYHIFPVADNEMPSLSADRLEYMYPSGAALDKIWSLEDIKKNYENIVLLKDENGRPELGFKTEEAAAEYTEKFIKTSLILQHNEDKIAMQLMADVLTCAEKIGLCSHADLFDYSEKELISRFDGFVKDFESSKNKKAADLNLPQKEACGSINDFVKLYKTFRSMKSILRSNSPMENCYSLSLEVKKRYINPLVKDGVRISKVNGHINSVINDFLSFNDSTFGCVPYAD